MNITKLNHRIDDIEVKMLVFILKKICGIQKRIIYFTFQDEIVREKLKIEKVGNEVGDTLDDIFTKY